ncbi:hypothetical protein IPL85_01640 [Candidatus Saccharibacteria bacterium]|nr:MAG: hypothetical protein IPL85_01640 [Candidatus Saccharibacteria bacterium]
MDFRQFGSNPSNKQEASVAPVSATVTPPQPHQAGKKVASSDTPKWLNVLYVATLFGVAILLLLITILIARGNSGGNEFTYVKEKQYQAVFLNNGQVYFGDIQNLNSKYLDITNVYYLTQNAATGSSGQQQATGDYTLVKLGCQQIHSPLDRMLINRDQVTFWENLNSDGKVAKSIEEFVKQNPKGPDCSEQTSQTPAENAPSQASNNGSTPQNNATNNR